MTFETVFASFNIALIAGILAALLLVLGFLKMYKSKGAKKNATWIGVIGLAVFLIGAFGNVGFLIDPVQDVFGAKTLAGVGPVTPPGETQFCQYDGTTVYLSGLNGYTTAPTGGTHRFIVCTDGTCSAASTVSDGGSFNVNPFDTLKVLWENGTAETTTYFSLLKEYTIPCTKTHRLAENLIQNGTVEIQVFNEEGNLIDASAGASANNETLGIGDVVTLEMKVKGTYQRGVPYGGLLVCNYNRTMYDDCIVEFGGTEVNLPARHSVGSNYKAKAYGIPAIESNEILVGKITIDVDDTYNPSTSESALNLTFYPYNYFVNDRLGGKFDGPAVEDEDDNAAYSYEVLEDILVK